jgi:hypothetical protein
MNQGAPIILITLSAIAIVGAFYYAAGALINVGVGIRRLGGDVRISAVPFVPSLAGVASGLIASIYFRWLPVWAAVLIALAPDAFYIFCSIVLGLRARHGFVPRDRDRPVPAEDHR